MLIFIITFQILTAQMMLNGTDYKQTMTQIKSNNEMYE